MEKFYQYGYLYWIAFIAIFSFYARYISIDEYRSSTLTEGVVVRKLEKRGRYGRTLYYPQYEFKYKDTVYMNADESFRFSRYGMGGKVKIIFPKGQPREARIYTFFSFWLERTSLLYYIVIGVILFFLPLMIRNLSRDIKS